MEGTVPRNQDRDHKRDLPGFEGASSQPQARQDHERNPTRTLRPVEPNPHGAWLHRRILPQTQHPTDLLLTQRSPLLRTHPRLPDVRKQQIHPSDTIPAPPEPPLPAVLPVPERPSTPPNLVAQEERSPGKKYPQSFRTKSDATLSITFPTPGHVFSLFSPSFWSGVRVPHQM